MTAPTRMPALSLFALDPAISLPAHWPAARRRGGSIVAGIAVIAIRIVVIGVVIDDRSGDLIEDQRTHIRLALEVEHVVERICIPVNGSGTCRRSNRAID